MRALERLVGALVGHAADALGALRALVVMVVLLATAGVAQTWAEAVAVAELLSAMRSPLPVAVK